MSVSILLIHCKNGIDWFPSTLNTSIQVQKFLVYAQSLNCTSNMGSILEFSGNATAKFY